MEEYSDKLFEAWECLFKRIISHSRIGHYDKSSRTKREYARQKPRTRKYNPAPED